MGAFDEDVVAFPDTDDALAHAATHRNGASGPMPGAMLKTQTEYQTAIAVIKPRDLKDVEARVLAEAARMGVDFVYSWRVSTKDKKLDEGDGKTTIEGMSIDGAMVIARNWGNCAVPIRLEQETETHFLLRADFIDLETGFSFPRLYRQRKNQGQGGRMDADRAEDIAFQIGQSKAQRNVIDKALPEWLIDRATMAAKSAALKKYGNVGEWRPKVIAAFKTKYGVEESRLTTRLKKPADQWTAVEILKLDMIMRALKDGESTVGEEFPVGEGAANSETAKAVEEALRAKDAPPKQAAEADVRGHARGATPTPAATSTPANDAPAPAPKERKPRTPPTPQGAPRAASQQSTIGEFPGDPPPTTVTQATPVPAQSAPTQPLASTEDQERALVNAWNLTNAVGCAVRVKDRRKGTETTSTTAAEARLFGQHAIIEVNDGQGGRVMAMLEDVTPWTGG